MTRRKLIVNVVLTLVVLYGVVKLTDLVFDSNSRYESALAAGKADREKFYAVSPEEQNKMLSGKVEGYTNGLGFAHVPVDVYRDANGRLWVKDGSLVAPWGDQPDPARGSVCGPAPQTPMTGLLSFPPLRAVGFFYHVVQALACLINRLKSRLQKFVDHALA